MKRASAIIRESIDPVWGAAGIQAVESLARHIEAREADWRDGDYYSGLAQDRYENGLVEESRRIVAGEIDAIPTREHLRILLERLDAATSRRRLEEGASAPF